MISRKHIFTSESVSEGHPDKLCDQLSDAILDKFLSVNSNARSAVECMVYPNNILIAGEIRGVETVSDDEIISIARNLVKKIGYEQKGFHWRDVNISVNLNQQSPDIAVGVDKAGKKDIGAGDQGMMFGYACDETENYMPASINWSNLILRNLAEVRRSSKGSILGPDAKSQVSVIYENEKPIGIESIVASSQHSEDAKIEDIKEIIHECVKKSIPKDIKICSDEKFHINPAGRFVTGGPVGDVGLTGRKIIVDSYGGAALHGGGAFSGKDATKIDRSAAYMMRYLAKNVVHAGLAERCTIQIAYAIGISEPTAFYVNTHGTGKMSDSELEEMLRNQVSMTPKAIIERLQLNKAIYLPTACYGHFGRDYKESTGRFSWEKLDLSPVFQAKFG